MNYIYKRMSEEDFGACALELMEAFKVEPWNENWTYEQAFTRIYEIMSAKVSRGYVICDGNVVVAMACGRIMTYLDSKELWIDELSVNPLYHRQGMGSEILNFIKEELKKEENKIKHLVLNTEKGFPAVDFYKSNGFKEVNTSLLMACKLF